MLNAQMTTCFSILTSFWRVNEETLMLEAKFAETWRPYRMLKATTLFTRLMQEGVSDGRMWMLRRPQGAVFWSNVLENFTADQWRQHFRMSRTTFEFVLQLVEQSLRQKTTNWRKPLEPRHKLAIVLWWYATLGEYRTISCLFGVGLCLYNRFAEHGYPICAGGIDGSHIPIIAPQEDSAAYHNHKEWHSIVLQAAVVRIFTDVYVGWPGRPHDARVFSNSPIFQMAEEQGGYLFPLRVTVHLIGDAAYPLKNWLMKGFTNHHALTPQQRLYNYRLSSPRMVVKNAFGQLKVRWRCLLKRNDVYTALMSDVVTACCVLHNICKMHKELFLASEHPAPQAQNVLRLYCKQ
uniref:Zmp:0000000634 n=1 Tax=Cyprinus carpio TaxID=7962 RepID=A0A8C1Q087_CYPCA